MNSLLNDDRDVEDRPTRGNDREITLGNMTILGIFFALAVLCAAFFGFGYATGRRQAPPALAGQPTSLNSALLTAAKPSAGNALGVESLPQPPTQELTVPIVTPTPTRQVAAAAVPPPAPVTRISQPDYDGAVVGVPPPTRAPATTTTPSPAVPGQFMVQVAAVSHQEDADLLVTTLKRVHYAVAVHQEPQDKLLHVQIGPFSTRKDADAMRLRLQADGFNAIVK